MADTGPGRERLFTGYSGRLSLLLAFGWLVYLIGRQVVSPLLPTIIEELSISPAAAGFALTIMWVFYSVLQYPAGRLSDQLSRKTVLLASLLVMVAGLVLLSVATSYAGFLLGVSLVGVGAGLYFTPTRALLSDLFTVRRGQAFGIQIAAGKLGSAISAGVAVVALAVATWRAAFLPLAAVVVVVLVLLHLWNDEDYVVRRVSLGVRDTGARVFQAPRIRWVLVAYTLFAFTSQAFSSFLPTFLQVDRGFSPTLASYSFGLLFVVAIVTGPVAGGLADLFSRLQVALVSVVLGAVGLVGVVVAPSVPLIVAGVVVYALGMWAYPPVMQAYLMDLFPDESMGGDFGAMKTIYTGIGSFGSTYVGLVAEQASYTLAFSGLVACLAAGTLVLLWLAVADHE